MRVTVIDPNRSGTLLEIEDIPTGISLRNKGGEERYLFVEEALALAHGILAIVATQKKETR